MNIQENDVFKTLDAPLLYCYCSFLVWLLLLLLDFLMEV